MYKPSPKEGEKGLSTYVLSLYLDQTDEERVTEDKRVGGRGRVSKRRF